VTYFTKLREVDPRTGQERQMRINNEIFFDDNMANDEVFAEKDRQEYRNLLNTFT
jgi:hypothetical protein